MAYDAKFLRVCEIQWLGVFIQDCDNYSIPQQCLLPLTAEGKIHAFIVSFHCTFFLSNSQTTDIKSGQIRGKLKRCYLGVICKEKYQNGGRISYWVMLMPTLMVGFWKYSTSLPLFYPQTEGLNWSCCCTKELSLRLKHCLCIHSLSCPTSIYRQRSKVEGISESFLFLFGSLAWKVQSNFRVLE